MCSQHRLSVIHFIILLYTLNYRGFIYRYTPSMCVYSLRDAYATKSLSLQSMPTIGTPRSELTSAKILGSAQKPFFRTS
jgi:hypothetical protein